MAVGNSGETASKQLCSRDRQRATPAEDRLAGSSPLNADCSIIQGTRSPCLLMALFLHQGFFITMKIHRQTQRLKTSSSSPNSKTPTVSRESVLYTRVHFSYFGSPFCSSLLNCCLPFFLLMSWEYQTNVRAERRSFRITIPHKHLMYKRYMSVWAVPF